MPSQDKTAQPSPFEITTSGKSKKIGKTGIIVGVSIVVFLILSVVAGILLVRQQQNVAKKAAVCTEACPDSNAYLLRSCHPVGSNGVSTDSYCNRKGRVETCGSLTTYYCCPEVNGSWTRTMTAECTANIPTTATATPNPTSVPTSVPTSTSTATPTPTATSSVGSCNKTCGSNSNCQSGLYCYSGYCRNPLCASDTTCGCSTATTTPTATATAKATNTTTVTTTTTAQTTPLPIPVSGTSWATYAGFGVGITVILVSILLAL